ncbi:MAG: hypothetical protein WAO76_10320 [Georgfuchsia sp.]
MAVVWKKILFEDDAVLVADTDVSGAGWVLDEDDMASDDATKCPTQQSVKAYVDAQIALVLKKAGILGTL